MSSFCRITGKARDQPKPNFFPIIPPISPADARKLCKITGRRMDDHNFVPLLEFGKRPDCTRCRVTGAGKVRKEMPKEEEEREAGELLHSTRDDYKYVAPILRKEVIDKEYQKSFEELQKLLKRLRTSTGEENEKYFVYLLESVLCGIIVPQEVEEAIRLGEIESLSISKNLDKAIFKMKGRPTMFIPLKESDTNKVVADSRLYNGKGQSKETLGRQKKVLEDKKKKMFATRKIFEDLERKSDEELLNDQDRPKGKARIFGGISKEAKQYRQKLLDFREMYTPDGNMALYGDWKNALKVDLQKLNWEKLNNIKSVEVEGPLPKQAKLSPPEDYQEKNLKRIKNIYDPGMFGLEVVPAVEEVSINNCPISKELIELIKKSKDQNLESSSSLKSMFKDDDALRILPFMDEFLKAIQKMQSSSFYFSNVKFGYIFEDDDGVKFIEDKTHIPKGSKIVSGVIVTLDDGPFFIPGEEIRIDDENKFIAGQRMSSVNGEFIPGASIRTKENEFKFLPGVYFEDDEAGFVMGQFIEQEDGSVLFTKGQVGQTSRGPLFIEGQTVKTADGLKFVAGLTFDTEIGPQFVCGGLVDMGEEARFVPGQMLGGTSKEPLVFIPGQMGEIMEKQVFVPGQTVKNPDGENIFLHGQMVDTGDGPVFLHGDIMVNNKNQVQFLPGQLVFNEEREKFEFIPGTLGEANGVTEFIEGRFLKKGEDVLFVPGKTTVFVDGVANRFDTASNEQHVTLQKSPSSAMLIDCNNMSMIFKKYRASPGVMVKTKNGTKFFPDGKIPDDLEGAEIIDGRMEYNKDGPVFVPGKVMEINGVKTFIPGKVMLDESGEEIFVPGKMIETKNGPKFVPGQVIETPEGEKFIPGKVLDTPDGAKFVPGQMIDTKSGCVFIPGQVIQTDNGMKFVPGQIVETESGAVFVPGQVIDSPDGCKFVPGQVIDTPEGPRLLPPDIKGDGDGEFCVQGFDVNQEEMRLLTGSSTTPVNMSDILSGAGGSCIAGEALKALAAGFQPHKSKDAIAIVGEQEEEEDIDKIMEDELLDAYDSPNVRQIIKAVFIAVFAEICDNIDDVIGVMDDYMCDNLGDKLENTIMSKMKLNPAIESLKKIFQEKNSDDPQEFEIMNLISGIISCSIPGALKECCDNGDDLEERQLKAILLDCIEESIRNILQEEGVIPKGLIDDIKELIQLAKELEFEGNQSFFSKVAAVSEGRCSSKFMNTLIKNFKEKASLPNFGFDMKDLLNRLTQILSPRMLLQQGFHILSSNMPDLVKDVLGSLKGDIRDIEGNSALDILHYAIGKIMNLFAGDELKYFFGLLEEDPSIVTKDRGVAGMIEQAIGLATYMNKSETAAALAQILSDPNKFHAVKADPIVQDILKKLLCMRKLAEKDPERRARIAKLQRFSPEDRNDMLLRELFDMTDLLLRPPYDIKSSKKLKKSRSMIKASKSMIMSSKDIPMNAFLAMKTTADKKDEGWLQNFLTESVVDEVPWECSKALIILKEGYQAIIPREASRSILLGEASYTLIGDEGIEFFLSPMDKKKRREKGMDDNPSIGKQKSCNDQMESSFNKSRKPVAATIIEEEEEEEEVSKPNKIPDPKYQKFEPKLMDDEDLSLFTKKKPLPPDSDEDDLGFERPSNTRRHADTFGKPIEEDLFDMEKYRPHNFEVSRPKGDDINDLVDYYSKYKTTRNAMARTNVGGMRASNGGGYNDGYYDDQGPNDDMRGMRTKKFSDPEQEYFPEDDMMQPQAPPRKKFSDPEDFQMERRRPSYEFGDSLDPATRLILMKNTDPGARPNRFDDDGDNFPRQNFGNQSRYGNKYEDDIDHLRPSPPAGAGDRPTADTAMSSNTRMMLDKLKQSTAELQAVTDGDDEPVVQPRRSGGAPGRQQKKSRFLRNNVMSDEPLYEEEDNNKYVNSLANSILGLRNDTMGDFDRFRPDPVRISPPKRQSRRGFDMNDDLPVQQPQRKFVDDDDTDAMIANLKQKTTRRAATDILRDLEKDTVNDTIKFEPIKSFKDTFRPSPEPEMNRYGSLNRMQSRQPKKSFLDQDDTPNPFSSLRGNQEPPTSNGLYGGGPNRKQYGGYGMEDDNGYSAGGQSYNRQQPGYGSGGSGPQQYGSLGRNGLGPAQSQQYPQQQQSMYGQGQPDMMAGGGGYGQDLYGMGGGGGMAGGYGYGAPQQYQQPYGQQPGYSNGMMAPQGGYDQMSYGQGGYGQNMGMGGGMGGYGQPPQQMQQQFQGGNLRQSRHQRYGANSGGW